MGIMHGHICRAQIRKQHIMIIWPYMGIMHGHMTTYGYNAWSHLQGIDQEAALYGAGLVVRVFIGAFDHSHPILAKMLLSHICGMGVRRYAVPL